MSPRDSQRFVPRNRIDSSFGHAGCVNNLGMLIDRRRGTANASLC
jgi:hypothetical protein